MTKLMGNTYKLGNSITNNYKKDGVVKLSSFFDRKEINSCLEQYEKIYMQEDRGAEIYRDEPLVVLWTHVQGANKKTCTLKELSTFESLIETRLVPFLIDFTQICYPNIHHPRLQLLETIVFNKPPQISNTLNWHQDVAYFPLNPNNQLAVWFPLADVTSEMGPMVYAHGSHQLGIKGSTNLHTREPFEGENRDLIPENPAEAGLMVKEYEMTQEDLLIHDGYTWHYSKPNVSNAKNRMGVSVRFIIEEARFDPRPGQGAAFTKQIEVNPGDLIKSPCFPIYWEK